MYTDSNEAAKDILNIITDKYKEYKQVYIEYHMMKVSFVFVDDVNKYTLSIDRSKLLDYNNTYSIESVADSFVNKVKEG